MVTNILIIQWVRLSFLLAEYIGGWMLRVGVLGGNGFSPTFYNLPWATVGTTPSMVSATPILLMRVRPTRSLGVTCDVIS